MAYELPNGEIRYVPDDLIRSGNARHGACAYRRRSGMNRNEELVVMLDYWFSIQLDEEVDGYTHIQWSYNLNIQDLYAELPKFVCISTAEDFNYKCDDE